jgi:hypothetical protein
MSNNILIIWKLTKLLFFSKRPKSIEILKIKKAQKPNEQNLTQRWMLKYSNKMTLFVQYFIPCKQLYVLRVKHSPIIRSSNKL